MTDASLTGIWQGLYCYSAFAGQVAFTATLLDVGGRIDGTTHEGGSGLSAMAGLEADLSGGRDGRSVRFTKMYRHGGEELWPIDYAGTLNRDGTEIEGRWRISDGTSGTFLMIRPERHSVRIRQRVEERA